MGEECGESGLVQAHLPPDGRRIQQYRTPALGHHLAEILAGDHVTRGEFCTRIDCGHIPFAAFVEQDRALAAYRFGNQEVLAHAECGGVELVELEVGDLGPSAPGSGQPVAGGDLRIRGVRVKPAGPAGCENHAVCRQGA